MPNQLKRTRRQGLSVRERIAQQKAKSSDPMKHMVRDHQDVLQNIEFIFVTRYRQEGDIDDAAVARTLQAAFNDDSPPDAVSISLAEALEEMREFRSDVSDDIWRDGLLTVLQSVQRHSRLRPGETEYLNFVSEFIV